MQISSFAGETGDVLTDTAEYALRSVLHLARRPAGHRVPSAAVAEELDLPANYLSKTMRTLAKEGVLDATRGPGGGFALARPADEITLRDVVVPFQELGGRDRCLLGDRKCENREPCAAHARWQELTSHVEGFFGGTTVTDLLDTSTSPTHEGDTRS